MDLTFYIDWLGDRGLECIGGLAVGLMFGFFAQRSQFCLRAATVEFWRGAPGPKLAIWLLVFFTALAGTQLLFMSGLLDKASVRQLSATGSLSGAIVGGLMFGVGMVLARGCASRLLVLSATGNMRAFMSGLLLTIVAQASLSGVLSPLRLARHYGLRSVKSADGHGPEVSVSAWRLSADGGSLHFLRCNRSN